MLDDLLRKHVSKLYWTQDTYKQSNMRIKDFNTKLVVDYNNPVILNDVH